MKLLDFAQNKKTYATVILTIGLAAYQGYTGHDIPNWVYVILGFAGLGFHRAAITQQANAIATLKDTLGDVLSQIEVPEQKQAELPPITDTTEVVDKPIAPPKNITDIYPSLRHSIK
jgi:hypothetical protein